MNLISYFINTMSADLEDTMETLFGNNIIEGIVPSAGSGLQVDVTSGIALVGRKISVNAQSIDIIADSNPGYIFLGQDGNFYVNQSGNSPSGITSFELCQYTSDASSVTNVTESNRDPSQIITPQVELISGSESCGSDPTTSIYTEITHTTEIKVPGFIEVSVPDDAAYSVERAYPERDTSTSFWVRVYPEEGVYSYYESYDYYEAGNVVVSYEREGMTYETRS